jgi:pimeloyl-ACP methyl ester carboxylesterase
MVSAPGPQWHLRPRHDFYARAPWLFGPAFLAEAPWRLRREIAAALPDAGARRAFTRRQLRTVLTSPLSLSRMAARARAIGGYDRVADCARVGTPTLIVHGDPALDHVTGDGGTELYAGLIPNARSALLERTGHLGSVTRAEVCARLIHEFLVDAKKDAHHSAA